MLLEEYVGFGDCKERGGWLQHYYRVTIHELNLHLAPYMKKKDPDDPHAPTDERMTPQQQEEALQEELRKDAELLSP